MIGKSVPIPCMDHSSDTDLTLFKGRIESRATIHPVFFGHVLFFDLNFHPGGLFKFVEKSGF
jgi:hypothetical protein